LGGHRHSGRDARASQKAKGKKAKSLSLPLLASSAIAGAMPVSNANTIRFILLTLVIDAIGFGIIIPVAPNLLREVGHFDLATATITGGWMNVLFASFQFVFGTIIGNLGDRFGRRPILLGALGGFAINFFLQAQAQSVIWLFIGQAIAGVFGGTYGSAQAALADITPAEERARVFGYVGAAFGIGFVIGPVIGGFLGTLGPRVPFYAASGLAALNFCYGFMLFPETLKPENRRAFDWRRANPFGALMMIGRLPGVTGLAAVLLVWQIASLVYPITWSIYMIAAYHASTGLIGLSLAGVGLSMAAVQILLTGRLVKRFGERGTVILGLTIACWTFSVLSISPFNPWLLFLALVMPLGNVTQPSLMAMMSKRATATNQGEVQGFSASVMSLGSIIAPLIFSPVLSHFISPTTSFHFPGAAFVIAAVFALCAMTLLALTPRLKTPVQSAALASAAH
jgi:DHA1 family tetracycline resistance protein-like MFS transporter